MDTKQAWAEEITGKIRTKMQWVCEKNQGRIPYTTDENGSYDDRSDSSKTWNVDDGLNWWTNGFWGGIMWLMYQDTGERIYADTAVEVERKLSGCLNDFWGMHHDVGFMFMPTAVADYRLTGNKEAKRTAMHAANLLAGRFNPAGRFIRAWNDPADGQTDNRGWAIIDCMFNISLLYWASKESKDPRFRQMAMLHADTVMQNFVRPDGSVCHIVEFDPETGERLRSHGGQGYARGSSWSRGQAWALYGFVISYFHTGKKEYLDTAKKVAHYCMANIPETGIVRLDFRQPNEPAWEDSCAACIMAGGLIELAGCLPEAERAAYREFGIRLLRTIAEQRADFSTQCDAIVQNCSTAYHDAPHHITMNYADYFFIEAIGKLTGSGSFMW
jgi:unsaturated chondroitin disaccharide hydrolase